MASRAEIIQKMLKNQNKISCLRTVVLQKLQNRLWHTTSNIRYKGILNSGYISPNPKIPESERWKTSGGPNFYPYVRTLEGISLFDFDNFDPDGYEQKCPMSNWHYFVPYREDWGQAIWIQIDKDKIRKDLISAPELLAKWKREKAERHTIMPHIEAAHIGPIYKSCFVEVFSTNRNSDTITKLRI
jgi:hypothetical protein